jgi:hypothetical protein
VVEIIVNSNFLSLVGIQPTLLSLPSKKNWKKKENKV